MKTTVLAKIISRIFDPILVLPAGVLALIWSKDLTDFLAASIFMITAVLFLVIPTLAKYLTLARGELEPQRVDRDSIYLNGIFGFSISAMLFGSAILPGNDHSLWFNLTVLFMIFLSAFYVINHYFDKASLHIGMFTFWVMICAQLLDFRVAVLLLFLLPIGWSRIELHKHTWRQLALGLFIGSVVGAISWWTLV